MQAKMTQLKLTLFILLSVYVGESTTPLVEDEYHGRIYTLLEDAVSSLLFWQKSECCSSPHRRLCTSLMHFATHSLALAWISPQFNAQNETTAWWVGFHHPEHGDQYWTFGESSDTNNIYPPDVPATIGDHFYIANNWIFRKLDTIKIPKICYPPTN